MLTPEINFTNFKLPPKKNVLKKKLLSIIKSDNEIIKSLSKKYKYKFSKKNLKNYNKYLNVRIIGMGGSSLGAQAIYTFFKDKIKKKFHFVDNLQPNPISEKKKFLNIIISKSGNTTETIVNANVIIKKKDKNIFITEKKNSYLYNLAEKLKSDIIHHNNYIGGRYSVLSEVGMLPAELMGLNSEKFKNLNSLVKNKNL